MSQDTNGENSNNSKSEPFYLDGVVDAKRVNRSFCLKTSRLANRLNWPRGKDSVKTNHVYSVLYFFWVKFGQKLILFRGKKILKLKKKELELCKTAMFSATGLAIA